MSSPSIRPTLIVIASGLSPSLLGDETPTLGALAARGSLHPIDAPPPARAAAVRATLFTGQLPAEHGVVGDLWRDRIDGRVVAAPRLDEIDGPTTLWRRAEALEPSISTAFVLDGPDPAAVMRMRLRDEAPALAICALGDLLEPLARYGPDRTRSAVRRALSRLDHAVAGLLAEAEAVDRRVILVSDHGTASVVAGVDLQAALDDAFHVLDGEGAPAPTMVAEGQIARVSLPPNASEAVAERVRATLEGLPGVDQIWDRGAMRAFGLDHPNAGDFAVLSRPDAAFVERAPAAPAPLSKLALICGLFSNPAAPARLFADESASRLRAAPRGGHGRPPDDPREGAFALSSDPDLWSSGSLSALDFCEFALAHLLGPERARTAFRADGPGSVA